MSDTIPRPLVDQGPVGYKPLPGTGNTSGPDLKSLVFATVGVALGIMAGTIFADGSWRSFVPGMNHQPVLASSTPTKSSSPLASPVDSQNSSKAAPPSLVQQPAPATRSAALELQASAQAGAAYAAPGAKPTPIHATEVSRLEPPASPLPQTRLIQPALHASMAAPALHPVYRAYNSRGASLTSHVSARRGAKSASGPSRWDRMMAARSRLAHLRKLRLTRRLHSHPRTVAYRYIAPAPPQPAPDGPPDRFAFTVEGSVTVTNYDPSAGRIQTYEGETFVVEDSNAGNDVSNWVDYPADLHYTCNETWNCTLVHGGTEVVSARRTQ